MCRDQKTQKKLNKQCTICSYCTLLIHVLSSWVRLDTYHVAWKRMQRENAQPYIYSGSTIQKNTTQNNETKNKSYQPQLCIKKFGELHD